MKLFSLNTDYKVIWEPQTLLLAPFAALYKRDKTRDKIRATQELSFVWFFVDIKSDYKIHADLKERTEAIKADLRLPRDWAIDKVIQEAIDFYERMSSTVTSNILKDSIHVANKLSKKMKEAVDAEGTLDISEISKLIDGVRKMPDVIKAIQEAEKAVLKEIAEASNNVGSKEKALFEDGL